MKGFFGINKLNIKSYYKVKFKILFVEIFIFVGLSLIIFFWGLFFIMRER